MFFAVILACSVIDADRCILIEDTRGPYETVQQCESRVQELLTNPKFKDAISSALKSPTIFAGACKNEEDDGHNI